MPRHGFGKGGSLTRAVQQKVTNIVDQHRQEVQDTEGDAADISWQNVESMMELVMKKDYASRRLKTAQLLSFVEQAIREVTERERRTQQKSGASQDDNEGQSDAYIEDSTEEEEEPSVPMMTVKPTNFMNKLVRQNYTNSTPPQSPPESEDSSKLQKKNRPQTSASESGPTQKKTKTRASSVSTPSSKSEGDHAPPNVRYSDLGGIDQCIEEIRELIEAPIRHPEVYIHLHISPPRGVLLHGPPGCGKTKLAKAVAGELGVPFIQISAPSIVSGMSGESEKKIREVFTEARELAPCLLFIDEIDAITPKRETAQREMERRIVAQLLTCMDELSMENTNNKPVIVIGATNRPDSLDTALRRAGRFDREISMGIPDEKARIQILKVMTTQLRLAGDFDFERLAKLTPGYVGADLSALTTAAGVFAIKRIFGLLAAQQCSQMSTETEMENDETMAIDDAVDTPSYLQTPPLPSSDILRFLQLHPDPLTEEQLQPLYITMDDFTHALKKVQPSSKREGFASVPGVSWSDIGALAPIRDELRMSIVEPIQNPALFASVGIHTPAGVLLWGPPGCGKTLLAKAVANESHCNFLSVKGPELLNKYVGESERGIRQVFARARASAPCVIFFDELDALCPRRGDGSDSQTSERVVNQLLTELDGLEGRKNVFIIGATNRPDIIDRAMLRPGRFDKLLYVQLPTPSERHDILKTLCTHIPLDASVDLHQIAHSDQCHRFSGADLSSLVREAGLAALRESLRQSPVSSSSPVSPLSIHMRHFHVAMNKVYPSVSEKDLMGYDRLQRRLLGPSLLRHQDETVETGQSQDTEPRRDS